MVGSQEIVVVALTSILAPVSIHQMLER